MDFTQPVTVSMMFSSFTLPLTSNTLQAKDAADQLQLIADIAATFTNVTAQELNEKIAITLEKLGTSLGAVQVQLRQTASQPASAPITWHHPSLPPCTDPLAVSPLDASWWQDQGFEPATIQGFLVEKLPASNWKNILLSHQINYVLVTSLVVDHFLVGIMELWLPAGQQWQAQHQASLTAIVSLLSNAISRKRAEEKIRRDNTRIKQFQQIAHLGTWEFDTKIKNVKWSEETYRIYGYPFTQDASQCFKDVIRRKPLEEQNQFKRMIMAALQKKKPYNYDIKIITPHNEVKYAQVIGQPLEDESGKVVKIHGVILDITERKQAEDKLKTALQQKEVLLKEVYHRVKNNLAMVEGLLFLQKNLISEQKYIDMFDECEKRIHSMALIHRNLYQSDNLNTIDINKYINELIQHIAMSSAHKNKVEINITVKAALFDLNQAIPLGLITNELVTNSFKYAFQEVEKPRLTVSLVQHKGKYEFKVKDNGTGFDIRPEHERNTLGISLVTMLTSDLNGEIFFSNKNGSETKIIF